MSRTAVTAIRELAKRMGELHVVTSTSAGANNRTVISTQLDSYFPATVEHLHAWIYCMSGANAAQEARADYWAQPAHTLSLLQPGFTATTQTAIVYEIHLRTQRARKLEALNSGIRQLGLYWPREVIDTSLTTVAGQYEYTLPGTTNWNKIDSVAVQSSTTVPARPYAEARGYNWDYRRSTSSAGVETWTLVFGETPPAGRIIRVTGTAYFTELVLDADILPIAGKLEGAAYEWLMRWAKFQLLDETVEGQPTGQTDRYKIRAQDMLVQQGEMLARLIHTPESGRIRVPGTLSLSRPFPGLVPPSRP